MSNTATLTKEQIEKELKNDPELIKSVENEVKNADFTGDDISYKKFATFKEAKIELGLVSLKGNDLSTTYVESREMNAFSGGITQKELSAITGKTGVNICFGPILDSTNSIIIDPIETEIQKADIDCDEPVEIIRVNLLSKDKNGVVKTINHIPTEAFVKIGNSHKIGIFDLNCNSENNTKTIPEKKVYIDIDTSKNKIRIGVDKTDLAHDNNIQYYFIVPIMVKKSMLDNITSGIEESYKTNYDNIISKFVESYDGEQKEILTKYVKDNFDGNVDLNKYKLMFDFNNNFIKPIKDAFEQDSNRIDELNAIGSLFPKYGAEKINIDDYVKDEDGIVIINAKDKANLKIIGIQNEIIENIIKSSKESIKASKFQIQTSTDIINENKNKAYDAMCNLSIGIDDQDDEKWFNLVKENIDLLKIEVDATNSINSSTDFMESTQKQLAGFTEVSRKIQKKIDNGEFTNAYLYTCVGLFNKLLESSKISTEEHKEPIVTGLFKLINDRYANDTYRRNQFEEVAYNSLTLKIENTKPNQPKIRSISSIYGDHCTDLINIKDVDINLSANDIAGILMNKASARYNFLKAISIAPVQLLTRIYPELTEAITGKPVSDEIKANAEKSRTEYGFTEADSLENKNAINNIIDTINELRSENSTEVGFNKLVSAAAEYLNNVDKFAKLISSKKYKHITKKLRAYCESVVILDSVKYIESVALGLSPTNNLDEAFKFKNIDPEYKGSVIETKDDFNKLSEEEKTKWIMYKQLTKEERINIYIDYVIKTTCFAEFMNILPKLMIDYDEEAKGFKENTAPMFTSALSLIVPGLNIVETLKIEDISNDNFNVMDYVENDRKASMGTTAVKASLAGIYSKDDIVKLKNEYVKTGITYFSKALDV